MLELLWLIRPLLPGAVYDFLLNKILTQFWEVAAKEESIPVRDLLDSERGVILDAIFKGPAVDKILEVGCGFGQNFWFLRRILPYLPLTGIERDQSLFIEARSVQEKLKLKKIDFVAADASKKIPFEDQKFDLSYTCAALLYTSAENIEGVVSELIRVTKKRILLMEQHQVDDNYNEQHLGVWVSKGQGGGGYWLRDYKRLFKGRNRVRSVETTRVKKPRFSAESWQDTANLIVVELDR